MNARVVKMGRIVGLATALLSAASAPARAADPADCGAWLRATLARVEKRPERTWRPTILAAFGEQRCLTLPGPLRRELRAVHSDRETADSERALADAAAAVVGPQCTVTDARLPARTILWECPLPSRPEFELDGKVLTDLRVVDYVLVGALATILIRSNAYDDSGRRLMMDLLLSAAVSGEAKEEPHRRSSR